MDWEKYTQENGKFSMDLWRKVLRQYLEENKIPIKEDDLSNDTKGLDELPGDKDDDSDSGISETGPR